MRSEVQLRGEVDGLVDRLAELCRGLDADRMSGETAAHLITALSRAERLAQGGRTRLARRAIDAAIAGPTGGARGPVGWLAQVAGVSERDARAELDTSAELPDRPHLDAALGAGVISKARATAILPGIKASAESEASLVGAAADGTCDVADLRRKSRKLVADADPDPDATRDRHHRRRSFRSWTAADGEWQARINGPADAGAEILAAIRAATDEAFHTARREGRREGQDAYAFDGLLATLTSATRDTTATDSDAACEGPGDAEPDDAGPGAPDLQTTGPRGGRGSRARERKVIGIIDVTALVRGRTLPGETCSLAGIGPVSVAAIRDLLGDATTALLFRRGTVDLAVAHLGRQPTAFQRTALEARDYVCAIDGCGHTQNLEIDHTRDWAATRRTRTSDLDWLCPRHHRAKTRGHITLTGQPGRRTTIEPPAPDARAP